MRPPEITTINDIGIIFTLLMGVLLIFLPRRFALVPVVMTVLYITLGQQVVVETLNFTPIRLLILFGWARLLFRRDFFLTKVNVIDKVFILWAVVLMVTGTILESSMHGFINRLGVAYNALGFYFLFRCLIRDFEDIERAFKVILILSAPLAMFMLMERLTGLNIFAIFGGVPFWVVEREGGLRAQGTFAHAILAGTFGASWLPVFIVMWFKEKTDKLLAVMGFVLSTIITIASASSGPIITYALGILGLAMWPFRKNMRVIRWGILLGLIGLHLYMKAPVWYLISRISNLLGGTGWHRSQLITEAIRHFNEWWFVGTKYTAHWMAYTLKSNPDMVDITNQYLIEGVDGGIFRMILFIIIIIVCFRELGRALRSAESQPFHIRITLWSVGVVLFTHVLTFTSVSYWDQSVVFWYFLLAIISTISNLFSPDIEA
jgi:hypothetical protein